MKNTMQEKKMTLEKQITWTSVCRRRNNNKKRNSNKNMLMNKKISSICPPIERISLSDSVSSPYTFKVRHHTNIIIYQIHCSRLMFLDRGDTMAQQFLCFYQSKKILLENAIFFFFFAFKPKQNNKLEIKLIFRFA